MDYKPVALSTLNGGVVEELFSEELEKVLANIADPNTKPTEEREITIKIKIKPTEERSNATTRIQASSKLAKVRMSESFVVLSHDGSSVKAYTTDPRQGELYDEPGNIVNYGGEK